MSNMKMEILKNDRTGEHFLKVSISSEVRTSLWSEYLVPMDKYSNESDFLKEVGIAAGALAEYQNESYGDNHDPSEFVSVAVKQARTLYNEPIIKPRDYDKELG